MLKQSPSKKESVGFSMKEIERKWLVSEVPNISESSAEEIRQGYLMVAPDGSEERVRERAGVFYFTRKGVGSLERTEEEQQIPRHEFLSLWEKTDGRRVEKTRYRIPYEGLTIEVDVYRGALAGLVLAEVEFSSLREAQKFSPPGWFGREVTDDPAYKNRNLALAAPAS
jgi:CYTH domain-containing protein